MSTEPTKESRRLYQHVVDKMLTLLDSGEYPAGARLPSERELSERFAVGRPTVREAIIALEVTGRVEVKTGSGVYVREHQANGTGSRNFSPFELTEARVLIEGEAAALAASMITDQQLDELKMAFDEMVLENEQGRMASEKADRMFHSVISKATRNRVMATMIEQLWDIQEQSPEIHCAHEAVCHQDGQQRLVEHKDILDALINKDPQAARLAMRRHFSRMLDALHDETEARAVEEVRRTVLERRERFSINRLNG